MKKCYFLLIFSLAFTYISAQNLSIGFKDGIGWANAHYRNDGGFLYKFDKKSNLRNSGILASYKIKKYLSLLTEIDYQAKGFEFTSQTLGGSYHADFTLDYLSIPLFAQYQFGNTIKYYGYLGLYTDLLISVENQNTSSSTEPVGNIIKYDHSDYDASVDFNKVNLGYLLGLGLKFQLFNNVNLFLDGRYMHGLTRSVKGERTIFAYRIPEALKDITLYCISVNWGVYFNIPGKY